MSAPRSRATKAARPFAFDKVLKEQGRVLGTPKPIKIGGKVYKLPSTIPLSVTEKVNEGNQPSEDGEEQQSIVLKLDLRAEILAELFGPEQWAEIRKVVGYPEVAPLFGAVFDLLRESVGEASPSGDS